MKDARSFLIVAPDKRRAKALLEEHGSCYEMPATWLISHLFLQNIIVSRVHPFNMRFLTINSDFIAYYMASNTQVILVG